MQKDVLQNFAIVDVETTGSSPQRNRILEIAVIRIENNTIVEKFQTVLDPETSIPASITMLTGISEQDIKRAPTFNDISTDIERLFKDAVFVAHNAQFDYGFVKAEFQRLGIHFSAKRLCTVALSRKLFPNYKHHDLSSLIERYDFTCSARHRAMGDAEVLVDFLEHCRKTCAQNPEHIHQYEEIIKKIINRGAKPTYISQDVIESLPETSGVYTFYGENGEKLYIGKSINIKKRVLSHFSDALSGKALRLSHEVRDIEAETTHGELSALLLESERIKREQPLYNRLLRHAKKLIVAEEVVDPSGYKRVELHECSMNDPDEDLMQNNLGLFKSMSQAKKTLRDYTEKYNLCAVLLGLEKSSGSCFSYQIKKCSGACIHKESCLLYNARFDAAFSDRKIKTWPYPGPIVIDEKSKTQKYSGTLFIVDNWRLVTSFTYDEYNTRDVFLKHTAFDYDAYKILAQYILKNKKSIKILSPSEFKTLSSHTAV